ncbi:DUF5707 domain-containing protein [Streptomyces spiramenti]|uniref:Calcium-binding protein n=1 Tax=Streptomyces spiramenti TaxID=2720606 RepID=A0ABX1ADZ6_9ACTN|nr:DUF5707 domain-containing protein [Streptomyces spiramenti]NJP65354.1 hypothetical protein [Streptomyces spiramenti]
MNKRVLVSAVVGVVTVGALAAGGMAVAAGGTSDELAMTNAQAEWVTDKDGKAVSLTVTTDFEGDFSGDSALKSVQVVALPEDFEDEFLQEIISYEDEAECTTVSEKKVSCVYTATDDGDYDDEEYAGYAEALAGEWTVSVLATTEGGETLFVKEATTFTVAF